MEVFHELDETSWQFKASDSWVLAFKKRHGIVSRKATHIITRITAGQEERISEKAKQFVDSVKEVLPNFDTNFVFNADQMGFPLEMSAGRTLAFKGEHKIKVYAQRMNAVTHSCTVLPMISMSGKLGPRLFMQLQETNGTFPQNWSCQRPNVVAVAGKKL